MLETKGVKKHLKSGEVYFLNKKPSLIKIEEGIVKIYVLNSGGQERILFIALSGDYISDLQQEEGSTFYLQAKKNSRIRIFTPQELTDLWQDQQAFLAVFRSLSHQVAYLSQELKETSFNYLKARLANKLLYFNRYLQGEDYLDFSHQELADLMGVSRITITRGLKELAAAGLISKGRRKIKLLNSQGLQELVKGGE